MNKKEWLRLNKVGICFFLLGNFILCLTLWLNHEYAQIHLDEVLFQLKSPTTGVKQSLLGSAILFLIILPLLLTIFFIFMYQKICDRKKSRFITFINVNLTPLIVIFLLVDLVFFCRELNAYTFVKNAATESDFIEENYVNADLSLLHFPEKKRNLVYIFLESMENTFADEKAGKPIVTSYIPELQKLSKDNLNFSHNSTLGGAYSFPGTTWTAAAMVAQTSGVNIKVNLLADVYGKEGVFLPGLTSIGDILSAQGYKQELLLGSYAIFHGRDAYFTQHGNYLIKDVETMKKEGRLPEDYEEWWGFEDKKLFEFAKEELLALSESDEPFNLTLLSADTHFPDGYHCELCQNEYEMPYANVLRCSSRQVADFVDWIRKQSFYENTTIIISGDHLSMDASFMEDIDEGYQRTIYNCIINAPLKPVKEKNRSFGTFDMFPTTLAALGVQIEGERLGLGTNLFSDEETLCEKYGYEKLFEELQKESHFYDRVILNID